MPSAFWPHRGGVEELTLKLGQYLLSRGHAVRVLTNRWPLDLPATEVVEGIEVERYHWSFPSRRPASRIEHWRRAPSGVRRVVALAESSDLVHVQCPSSQLYFARAGAARANRPLVLTSQGETAMDAGRIYETSGRLRSELRRASAEAAALTACSAWTAETAATVAPRFASAEVVLNGVDVDDWDVPEQVEEPAFAAWGRLVPQKGFDLLLAAFAIVKQELPRATLVLGGDGPERAALEAVAGHGVSFAGALDRVGVRTLLSGARVAVVPSRLEPFGIVALEALAAGRGLVYSSIGGLAEAAGDCGRSADPHDVRAFAQAMLIEARHPTPAQQGRARAAAVSWSAVGSVYEALYERVLASHRAAAGQR